MVKGNFTEYLDEFQKLYSKLLEQGKDIYILGNDPLWIIPLRKKKRKLVNDYRRCLGYVELTLEDARDIKKLFPGTNKSEEEILQDFEIKKYSENGKYQFLSPTGLEEILKGKPFRAYAINVCSH